MGSALVGIIGGAGVILTAFVTLIVAVRRFGGTIESSEAHDLWEEAKSQRIWAQARIESLEKELERCAEGRAKDRERIAKLEFRIQQLEGSDDPPGHLA